MVAIDLLPQRPDTAHGAPDAPAAPPAPPPAPDPGRRARRERRAERRRLAALDRAGARRAELLGVRALLIDAGAVVGRGWCQDAWFVVTDPAGHRHRLHAPTARMLADREVTEACLVGALVLAGGGPAAVRTAPVRQALDLTWNVLCGDPHPADVLSPAPRLQGLRVRELTRWNDTRGRTPTQVQDLLAAAADVAARTGAPGPATVTVPAA